MGIQEEKRELLNFIKTFGDTTPLSAEEAKVLVIKAQNGSQKAIDELTFRNSRFVFKKALKAYVPTIELYQLFMAGIDGLLSAINKFDVSKENSFLTYANFYIEGEIREARKSTGKTLNTTYAEEKNIRKINAIDARLQKDGLLNEEERTEQIAYEVNLPVKEVNFLKNASRLPLSYSSPISSDDEETTLISNIADTKYPSPEEDAINNSLKENEKYVLSQIPKKQRLVLQCCAGIDLKKPQTLLEIGKSIGCTKAWVSQIRQKAVANIKSSRYAQDLEAYLYN